LEIIGTGWDKKRVLEAYIYLPSSVATENLKVFGHGPLNGKVELIDGNGAHYYVTNVSANTYVEARVIFPSSILNMKRCLRIDLTILWEKNLLPQKLRMPGED